jgi:hypothetical protein
LAQGNPRHGSYAFLYYTKWQNIQACSAAQKLTLLRNRIQANGPQGH